MADPYETLGVQKTDSDAAIRSAYRKLAADELKDREAVADQEQDRVVMSGIKERVAEIIFAHPALQRAS